MNPAFDLAVSPNLMVVNFDNDWDHHRHYQTLFNASGDMVTSRLIQGGPWALVINWGGVLVQIPEEERICLRTLQRNAGAGMTHVANIVEPHPVCEWQLSKLADENANLTMQSFSSIDNAMTWLGLLGFDTHAEAVPTNRKWLSFSTEFQNVVNELALSPSQFVHR